MITCPNVNLTEWKELVKFRGENIAYYLWNLYNGEVPKNEYRKFNTEIKSGVLDIYKNFPELMSIGNPLEYTDYLDSIFPDSNVKDIVYHGTLPENKFEKFSKQKATNLSGEFGGIHFGDIVAARERPTKIVKSENFIMGIEDDLTNFKPNIISSIINITNIKRVEEGKNWGQGDWHKLINNEKIFDGYIYNNKIENKGVDSYVVFEPEQIHILGSKDDIEGFKNFVNKNNKISENKSYESNLIEKYSNEGISAEEIGEMLKKNC